MLLDYCMVFNRGKTVVICRSQVYQSVKKRGLFDPWIYKKESDRHEQIATELNLVSKTWAGGNNQ